MKHGIYYAYWEKEWAADYIPYVEKVAKLGFDILEIGGAALPAMNDAQLKELKNAADSNGIIITTGYGPAPQHDVGCPQTREGAIEWYKKMFYGMEQIGSTVIGGALYSHWPVDYSQPINKAEDWKYAVEGMQILAPYAKQYDINLGMEVLNRFENHILNVAEEGVAFVKEVGHDNVKVEHLFNYSKYKTGLISDGNLYDCICNSAYLYSQTVYQNKPSNIFSKETLAASKMNHLYLVDVHQGKFLFAVGWQIAASFVDAPVSTTYQLKGATPVACGMMKSLDGDKSGFLVKAPDGMYYATTINYDSQGNFTFMNYNLSEIAQDLDQAKGFAFCDNADFFYYFTDREINVIITSGKNATRRPITWEPEDKSEKITGLYHYQQGFYGTQGIWSEAEYEHALDTHRLQLVITTYDESTGEGKIYLRPFNVTTGLFTKQSNGVYGGFKEITAITTTLR